MAEITHLAIIMDGNRRWAAAAGLKTIEGHRACIDTLEKIVRACGERGIKFLTVYALSTENLKARNPLEVAGLLKLMQENLSQKLPQLQKEGVRIEVFGDISAFPAALQVAIKTAYKQLATNSKIQLNFALNYGGRDEIVRAVKEIVASGQEADKIDEEIFASYLFSKDMLDPELVIRTGGQSRLSNFLLWQSAYSELYFTDTLWPDFSETELDKALKEFEKRKRNFGK